MAVLCLGTGRSCAALHWGVDWYAGGPLAHCAACLSTLGPPLCTRTMSLYLAWPLSRRANTVPASAMCLLIVMGASVPAGRCARVWRSFLARTKSRASMAAEVSYPVWLVWLPRLRCQSSPVSARHCPATASRMLEGVAAVSEVSALGEEFEFADVDLGVVLGAFEVAQFRCHLVDAAGRGGAPRRRRRHRVLNYGCARTGVGRGSRTGAATTPS